jgi:hypothetical protein
MISLYVNQLFIFLLPILIETTFSVVRFHSICILLLAFKYNYMTKSKATSSMS